MKRTKLCLAAISSLTLCLFLAFPSWAQVDVGDYTISGSLEVGGLVGHQSGHDAKFDEYRQADPNNYIVPELQLLLGSKKEDFYMSFDSQKPGYNDQNYRLRFGRYGLVDIEAEWDQFPHLFSEGIARTPYVRNNNGTYTLPTRVDPTFSGGGATFDGADVNKWLGDNAKPIDLGLLYGIGRFKIKYTPVPGWTFSGSYWSQHVNGDRAFGVLNGFSSSTMNISELAEPIDYQTHNIELGGEYAGNGWSLALKYNASLFHNDISTLIWDNPIHATLSPGGTGACQDSATFTPSTGTGPCRGRLDLYPSNQAHTITLTGAANLPLKTRFMGTVSYGWRLQDDSFLPFTINSCYTPGGGVNPNPAGSCKDANFTKLPTINHHSLNADVHPLMVNTTLVNNSLIDHLHLKAYYRLYDLNYNSNSITLPQGFVGNDRGALTGAGDEKEPTSYSKNTVGMDAGYDFTRWLTGKFDYTYDRMHRNYFETVNSNEFTFGPTVDVKPNSSILLRANYRHSWRDSDGSQNGGNNTSQMIFLAKRARDKTSLFADVSPLDNLSFHGGLEFIGDNYPDSRFGVQNSFDYSPSVGFLYSPLEWLKLFGDYNWDRNNWNLVMNNSTGVTARGHDTVNTFSLGSDMDLIKNVLGFRIQYSFSQAFSQIRNHGGIGPAATDFPPLSSTWHELLAMTQYQIHKNVALKFGYYFNMLREKDHGIDIMKPWMGDVIDPGENANQLGSQGRSIFLGDRVKGNYTAHIGFVALKFSF
jgi:hypothetical protein